MHEIRNILAATDLSATSDGVLSAAAEMAVRSGARLHVLHVFEFPVVVPVAVIGIESRLDGPVYEVQRANARRRLDAQLAQCVPAGREAATTFVEGEAVPRAICSHAEQVGADLIVIGPHADGDEAGAGILGTTADHVLRSATVPVLVLRAPAPLPPGRLLVPVDPTEPSAGIVEAALEWAAAFAPPPDTGRRVTVEVIHVLLDFVAGRMPFERATVEPGRNPELKAARERAAGAERVAIREVVLWGEQVKATILSYARESKPDLLVVGSHGHGAIKRALFGGTSSALTRQALCSVLLVPPALWAEADRAATRAGSRES